MDYSDYSQLSDAALILELKRGTRERCAGARTRFFTDAEVALTAEFQRRGMIDGDGLLRKRPSSHARRVKSRRTP